MNKSVFEIVTHNAIATILEPDESGIKEWAASIIIETYSTEQIEELILNLNTLNAAETLSVAIFSTNNNKESPKWRKSFIDLIRQMQHEKSTNTD